jgi:hypothetical protein
MVTSPKEIAPFQIVFTKPGLLYDVGTLRERRARRKATVTDQGQLYAGEQRN